MLKSSTLVQISDFCGMSLLSASVSPQGIILEIIFKLME
jgi:hypothetical protein